MKYYQVRWGFEPSQYISIEESELSKALRAQLNNSMAIFKSGHSITGTNIKLIEPDFHRHLKVNSDYILRADDLAQIPQNLRKEYAELLETTGKSLGKSAPQLT